MMVWQSPLDNRRKPAVPWGGGQAHAIPGLRKPEALPQRARPASLSAFSGAVSNRNLERRKAAGKSSTKKVGGIAGAPGLVPRN